MEEEKETRGPFDVADIVKRAKLAMGFQRDSELAAYLGVSRSTLSNWVARNSTDYPLLLERLAEVDYNWLLTGKGSPVPQHDYCDCELASGPVEHLHPAKCSEALDDRRVPLFNIEAAANLQTLLQEGTQCKLGEVMVHQMPVCDGALHVTGNSMQPLLMPGDILGFRLLSSPAELIYGEMYVVAFHIEGEQHLAVKYVHRSELPLHVQLVSYNPQHAPMDIPMECISTMALVQFSIRCNTGGRKF